MEKIGKCIICVGIALILGSFLLCIALQFNIKNAQKSCEDIISEIHNILPAENEGIMDHFSSMEMPVLQIDEEDFSAIIEIPTYNVSLPVHNGWNSKKINHYPCRFYGSVYDGSLVIGGVKQEGQFECFDVIQHDCKVFITDMNASKFNFEVVQISRSSKADKDVLLNEEYDLTLFVKDVYAIEYIIVRCNLIK